MRANVSDALRDTRVLLIDRSRSGTPIDAVVSRLQEAFPTATFSALPGNGVRAPDWATVRAKIKEVRPELALVFFSKYTRRRFVMLDANIMALLWRGPLRCVDEDWLDRACSGAALFPSYPQYWRWRSFAWNAADEAACMLRTPAKWLGQARDQVSRLAAPRSDGMEAAVAAPPAAQPVPATTREALLDELLARVGSECELLQARVRQQPSDGQPVLYTRLDYWNARAIAGGSLGHTAHVIRALGELGALVQVAAGFPLPMVDAERSPMQVFRGPTPEWSELHHEHQYFAANACMLEPYSALADTIHPAFIYERIVIGSCLGAKTAQRLRIPYVLEYNGSEIWILRHWAKTPMHFEKLFLQVEDTVLRAADLIVVVSEPLRQELLGRGIEDRRILVNPNAVDPQEFNPERYAADRERIREQYGFKPDDVVLGFIGTFGVWHGIPTLAKALPDLVQLDPRIRLLLIGDGNLRGEMDACIAKAGLQGKVVITGIVPQARAAAYLSACDIYLSPHQTPTDDSRPFFGSPTKLFEYMAMGKPTIASALGQIVEVLAPALYLNDLPNADAQNTDALGVLVKPGDAVELTTAVGILVKQPALGIRLAENARRRILKRHTWKVHVTRILDELAKVTGQPIRKLLNV